MTLSVNDYLKLEYLIISLLLAQRDCYVNQKRDVYRFPAGDGYTGEAFGMLRTLETLGVKNIFGEKLVFGADNINSTNNLKWWWNELQDAALKIEDEQGNGKKAYYHWKTVTPDVRYTTFNVENKLNLNSGFCIYDKAWVGKCGEKTVEGSYFCENHLDKKCSSCGKQATHECAETFQFVCGAPLCNDCEHKFKNGKSLGHGPK